MAEEGDFVASRATDAALVRRRRARRWSCPAERSIGWDILTDTAIGLGDLDEAERLRRSGSRPTSRGRPLAAVLATRSRAALQLARGRRGAAAADGARGVRARAATRASSSRARRAQLLLGRALAAGGDRTAAIRELRDAELALDAGGAHTLRDDARGASCAGSATASTRRAAAARPPARLAGLAALSAREREVVALVAAGRTNPAIAEELFLSVKTVETHLRNVFGKLGVAFTRRGRRGLRPRRVESTCKRRVATARARASPARRRRRRGGHGP